MENTATIIRIVSELNEDIYNKNDQTNLRLMFETDGTNSWINFGGTCIWDSDNEEREWIESDAHKNAHYEPMKPFLIKKMVEVVNCLTAICEDYLESKS